MVEANNDEEVESASAILHELGAFDVDERITRWRKAAGMDAGVSPVSAATDQASQRAGRPGVRVFRRHPGRSIRDLFKEHQDRAATRSAMNRPASTEGESRVIDRSERERAVASDLPGDANAPERDDDREPRLKAPGRDI